MNPQKLLSFSEFTSIFEKKKVEHFPTKVPENVTVSVCVQTYQHREYIEKCLESILMQETSFPFEIIVGEDESSDGTRDVCKRFAEQYPDKIRLILHKRENNITLFDKPSGRFNFIYNIFSARGKYIAFCEGDDFWTDRKKLQKQFEALKANQDCSVCFTAAEYLDEVNPENAYLYRPKVPAGKSKFSIREAIIDSGGFMPTASVFFRRELLKEVPFWMIESPVGDLPLTLLLGLKGSYLFLDEPMITYRVGTPMSWSSNQKDFAYRKKVINGICKTLLAFNKYSKYRYSAIVFREIFRRQFDLLKMFLVRKF